MESTDQSWAKQRGISMLDSNISIITSSSQPEGHELQTQITMPPQQATSFTLFVELPPELQTKIINIAARETPRLLEILSDRKYKSQAPVLLGVSHWVREEALKVYITLRKFPVPIYFNPDNDTLLVHLHVEAYVLAPFNFELITSDFMDEFFYPGAVKSFAIKPEIYGDNLFSHIDPTDRNAKRTEDRIQLSWAVYSLISRFTRVGGYTMVSSSSYDLDNLTATFHPNNRDVFGWRSIMRLREPKACPDPEACVDETSFYSKFGAAATNLQEMMRPQYYFASR